MNVVSIGTDKKVLEDGSAVAERNIEYGAAFGRLDIILVNREGDSFEKKLSENTIVHSVPSLWSAFRKAKAISRGAIITTQDPFETGLVGVLIKMFYGNPLQLQLHTDFRNTYFLLSSLKNCIRFFIAHLTLAYADQVRVVSERVKASIQDMNNHVDVLPIAIHNTVFTELERKRRTVLAVCRLEKEKDITTAIQAFALASKEFPEARFTIAGDGAEKEKLITLAEKLGAREKINFIGWATDLHSLYAKHEVYISTSLFEGYGMSIMEAAEAGCALVLSDAGIADSMPAFVHKPRDVRGFADSLEKMFRDPTLASRMGSQAKEAASSKLISWPEYLQQYKESILGIAKNYKVGSFYKRLTNFIYSIFEGNKILRFIVGGCTAASSQLILLYLFTSILGMWYLYSSILSFVVALSISFLIQKFWAFRDHGREIIHIQFIKYILVAISGLMFNTLFMYIFVDLIGIWYIGAQIMAGFFIAVYNFIMYKKFIFPPVRV